MKLKVQTLDAKAKGDIDLNDEVFGIEPRADILHRVVTWQLKRHVARLVRPANALTLPAPARNSVARKAAVSPVTAIVALRFSSVVVRLTVLVSATSTRC
jgi:hypothetical protein